MQVANSPPPPSPPLLPPFVGSLTRLHCVLLSIIFLVPPLCAAYPTPLDMVDSLPHSPNTPLQTLIHLNPLLPPPFPPLLAQSSRQTQQDGLVTLPQIVHTTGFTETPFCLMTPTRLMPCNNTAMTLQAQPFLPHSNA